jgi:hypothetical protein
MQLRMVAIDDDGHRSHLRAKPLGSVSSPVSELMGGMLYVLIGLREFMTGG